MGRIVKTIEIEGKPATALFDTGVDGHELDVLIGVLTMERYAIRLDPISGTLDLEGLRTKEFTEYWLAGRHTN